MGSDAIGVEVDGLHATGRTISGRAAGGGATAQGLLHGLDAVGGRVGHPAVKGAASAFVQDHVMDPATKLPAQLTDGGHNVSNVAATARDSDNAGAAALSSPIAAAEGFGDRINRQV